MKYFKHFEDFEIKNDRELIIKKPFDDIKIIKLGSNYVYALFGDIDYYSNKEAILALKGKNKDLRLNLGSYKSFLEEFSIRFNNIEELRNSEFLVSIDTSSNINEDIKNVLNIPYIKDGFKKKDSSFKMKNINKEERVKISDMFNINFDLLDLNNICIIDDFITSGTTFKNAFDILPKEINKVGICLFYLKS